MPSNITQSSQGMTVPQNYRRTFSNNWEQVAVQVNKRFGDCADMVTVEGKEKVFHDMDETTFKARTERLAKTVLNELTFSRRKMTKKSYSDHYVFDKDDKEYLDMLADPRGELINKFRSSWNRLWDEEFIAALDATVYGGSNEAMNTAIDFDSTNNAIAVNYVASGSAANSGLTMEKVQRARRVFEEQEYVSNGVPLFMALSPKQADDLFQQAKANLTASYADIVVEWYNDQQNKMLFGFKTIINNRLPIDSSDYQKVFCWAKTAVKCAADKVTNEMDTRPDLEHALQVSAYGKLAVMRRWENGVVRIACDRSP